MTHTYPDAGVYTAVVTASNSVSLLTATTPVSVNLPTRTITYTYDGLYRLTEADYSSGERFQYAYDAVGNRTAYTATVESTQVTTYSYDAANRLTQIVEDGTPRTLTWSNLGQLLDDGQHSYAYDAAGRLVSVTLGSDTTLFEYNGDGDRLSKSVNGTLTTYTLDVAAGLPQVLVAHECPNPECPNPESTSYLYGIARIGEDDGAWRYHLADHLGSVRSLVGADGSVEGTRAYRPYGAVLSAEGSASSIYGFTGEQTDPTGLVYLRARMYSPGLRQFTSRDPWGGFAGVPQSQNGYSYVKNNPMGWVDPSGYIGSPLGCNAPECYIFYFPGTGKINNQHEGWGHGEPVFIEKLRKRATDLAVIFPFGPGAGYTGEQIADLEARPGMGELCGEALGLVSSGSVQEQQVLDIWRGNMDWLFRGKALEVADQLNKWGVYADHPSLEIDFVAHSGGSHYAVGAAQALQGQFCVDNVVSLGGFFKVNYWDTDGLNNIGHLYDILGRDDWQIPLLRGPSCSGFDQYHADPYSNFPWGLTLWDLDNVEHIRAGGGHSSYFSNADVWAHLTAKTARLCWGLQQWKVNQYTQDMWSGIKQWLDTWFWGGN